MSNNKLTWGTGVETFVHLSKSLKLFYFSVNYLSIQDNPRFRFRSLVTGDGFDSKVLSVAFHFTREEAEKACQDFLSNYMGSKCTEAEIEKAFNWEKVKVEWAQDDTYLYVIYEERYESDNAPYYLAIASNKKTGEEIDLLGWDYPSQAKQACEDFIKENLETFTA